MHREGSLHILVLDPAKETYSITFTPYGSGGGALASETVHGKDELKERLRDLKIHEEFIETALQEIQRGGSCTMGNVMMGS